MNSLNFPKLNVSTEDTSATFTSINNQAEATGTLIKALSHHLPRVRSAAVTALVQLAPFSIKPLITAFYSSLDQGVQAYIIQALALIGNVQAFDLLAEVMGTEVANHCQGNVRRIAARGLGRISSNTRNAEITHQVTEKLIWALVTPEDWGLRYAAAVSLQEIATSEAIAALQLAFSQELDCVVRARIAIALQ
jgi:bilin biosynthesis PecF protein